MDLNLTVFRKNLLRQSLCGMFFILLFSFFQDDTFTEQYLVANDKDFKAKIVTFQGEDIKLQLVRIFLLYWLTFCSGTGRHMIASAGDTTMDPGIIEALMQYSYVL
jgi:hypothetical protein